MVNKQFCAYMFLLLIFNGCQKSYKYVEYAEYKNTDNELYLKESIKEIMAKNDTSAYLKAYSEFKSGEKMNKINNGEIVAFYMQVKKFKLYNSKGKDISDLQFKDKRQRESETQLNYKEKMDLKNKK